MLSKLKLYKKLDIVFYLRFSTTESINPNFFASSAEGFSSKATEFESEQLTITKINNGYKKPFFIQLL